MTADHIDSAAASPHTTANAETASCHRFQQADAFDLHSQKTVDLADDAIRVQLMDGVEDAAEESQRQQMIDSIEYTWSRIRQTLRSHRSARPPPALRECNTNTKGRATPPWVRGMPITRTPAPTISPARCPVTKAALISTIAMDWRRRRGCTCRGGLRTGSSSVEESDVHDRLGEQAGR